MGLRNRSISRYIAMLMIVSMVAVSIVTISTGAIDIDKKEETTIKNNDEDKATASQISNVTGVSIEKIYELKNQGKTWNEIMDELKNNGTNKVNIEKRDKSLLESGLDKRFINTLINQGYKEEEILEAKLLVERVIFQLNEIAKKNEKILEPLLSAKDLEENDIEKYRALLEKINLEEAVKITLALKEDFDSDKKALNEYLYSLQLDIDIEKYLTNKEEYEKEKKEKSIGIDINTIITLSKIEEKLLEMLQEKTKDKESLEGESNPLEELEDNTETPQLPNPNIIDTKPKDPLEDVMKEINDIQNESLNIIDFEGRD